jgi:hypothetical protein
MMNENPQKVKEYYDKGRKQKEEEKENQTILF